LCGIGFFGFGDGSGPYAFVVRNADRLHRQSAQRGRRRTRLRRDPSGPACSLDAARRQQPFSLPTARVDTPLAGITLDTQTPRKHALHVAIENRAAR
jgi:hypothetical protein